MGNLKAEKESLKVAKSHLLVSIFSSVTKQAWTSQQPEWALNATCRPTARVQVESIHKKLNKKGHP